MLKVRRTFGARVNAIAFANPSQSPAVTAPPKGEPSLIPSNTRIGADLPLPTGEVAMPLGIDGEGCVGGDAVFSPLSHLR